MVAGVVNHHAAIVATLPAGRTRDRAILQVKVTGTVATEEAMVGTTQELNWAATAEPSLSSTTEVTDLPVTGSSL